MTKLSLIPNIETVLQSYWWWSYVIIYFYRASLFDKHLVSKLGVQLLFLVQNHTPKPCLIPECDLVNHQLVVDVITGYRQSPRLQLHQHQHWLQLRFSVSLKLRFFSLHTNSTIRHYWRVAEELELEGL